MELYQILGIAILLIISDKGITAANILAYNKNFNADGKYEYYIIERNPLAKWFFVNLGLLWGSLAYAVISFGLFLIVYVLFGMIGFWVMVVLYALVLANNAYWWFKFTKVW